MEMTVMESEEYINGKHFSEWGNLLPGKTVILSIETTGLKPDNSELYVIGTLSFTIPSDSSEGDAPSEDNVSSEDDQRLKTVRKQWLIRALHEERTAALDFVNYLKKERFDRIITFYGTSFDLRFLIECMREFGLLREAKQLETYPHTELSKVLRPFRKALNLTDNRQQSFEELIGYKRSRTETSFQVSDLYRAGRERYYLARGKEDSFPKGTEEICLAYNRDKLLGVFHMLPLLYYVRITEPNGQRIVRNVEIKEYQGFLEIRGESLYPVLLPLSFQKDALRVDWKDKRFVIRVSLYRGELKLFFPDYKNYYYLPLEDTVIHKKLGSLVDPEHRKAATKETCYQKRSGIFLPENPACHTEEDPPKLGYDHITYREWYDSSLGYRDYREDLLFSEDQVKEREEWIGGLLLFALQN